MNPTSWITTKLGKQPSTREELDLNYKISDIVVHTCREVLAAVITAYVNEEKASYSPSVYWEIENYLWKMGFSHPADSELRIWYMSGWVELTNYRPTGPCPEYVMERARRRNP